MRLPGSMGVAAVALLLGGSTHAADYVIAPPGYDGPVANVETEPLRDLLRGSEPGSRFFFLDGVHELTRPADAGTVLVVFDSMTWIGESTAGTILQDQEQSGDDLGGAIAFVNLSRSSGDPDQLLPPIDFELRNLTLDYRHVPPGLASYGYKAVRFNNVFVTDSTVRARNVVIRQRADAAKALFWNGPAGWAEVYENVTVDFSGSAPSSLAHLNETGGLTLRNSIVTNTDGAAHLGAGDPYDEASHSLLEGSLVHWGVAMLYGSPTFVDADAGDYRLAPGSLGVDAGEEDGQSTDPDGSRTDMGAFGGPHADGHPDWPVDADDDGWSTDGVFGDPRGAAVRRTDCDDGSADIHPDAAELCDGLDNDCDPSTSAPGGEDDRDRDGALACEDCDDEDEARVPGGTEICDGLDNDCDPATAPPGPPDMDADGDGALACGDDCDDADPTVYPGAPEDCSDEDHDCDPENARVAAECFDDGCADCEASLLGRSRGAGVLALVGLIGALGRRRDRGARVGVGLRSRPPPA